MSLKIAKIQHRLEKEVATGTHGTSFLSKVEINLLKIIAKLEKRVINLEMEI